MSWYGSTYLRGPDFGARAPRAQLRRERLDLQPAAALLWFQDQARLDHLERPGLMMANAAVADEQNVVATDDEVRSGGRDDLAVAGGQVAHA